MWDLILSVPDHCLSFYFRTKVNKYENFESYLLTAPKRKSNRHRKTYSIYVGLIRGPVPQRGPILTMVSKFPQRGPKTNIGAHNRV